jgi:uncharacterized protein with HEPN domain
MLLRSRCGRVEHRAESVYGGQRGLVALGSWAIPGGGAGRRVALAGTVPGVDRELVERMVAAVEEIGALTGPEGVRATALASMRTLGEAAALVSPQLKQRRPEVPWGRLTDLGTLVADTSVADELVEQFATRDLPLLDMQLRSILGSLR